MCSINRLNLGHLSIFYDSAEFLFVTFSIFFDVPFDSSVGRAVDCRMSSKLSIGHWFNSGSKEVLMEKFVGISKSTHYFLEVF